MEFFDTLCRVIFYFMIYSVVGWIYETTLCSITDRHFVNRGFLNGPYCPIYGSGALLDVLILGRIENPFLLFILGVLVTCSLEYLTSYVMEKLFKARWWDYSDKKFNIGGRVCLLGAVVFGLFSVVLIKLLHPAVRSLADKLPVLVLYIISCVFAVGFIVSPFRALHRSTSALMSFHAPSPRCAPRQSESSLHLAPRRQSSYPSSEQRLRTSSAPPLPLRSQSSTTHMKALQSA